MSNSRSPSPTHNHLTSAHPHSTNSRPQLLEEAHFERHTTRIYTEPLTVHLSPPPPQVAESSSRRYHPRSADDSSEENMAKRLRRDSPEPRGRPDNHSSPSSDSDMADNDLDIGKARRPEPLATTAMPKKKRTRTLTTPHQSAILHALLAQSRFPTTAMREEVGRSIGLSARKVQIWFQNQRQKARRPRSQNDPPSSRPPQYGPFPSTGDSGSHVVRGFDGHGTDGMSYVGRPSPEALGGHIEMPVRLLGPGMPGAPVYPSQSYRQIPPIPVSAPPLDSRFQTGYSSREMSSSRPYTSPRMYPLPGARPATSQPNGWRDRDPSRILPPLVSTRPSSSTYAARTIHSSRSPPFPLSHPAFFPTRSISPDRFAHHPPEPAPRTVVSLPSPFTLQPSPHWDEAPYTGIPRQASSAWSRPASRSTRGRSISPVATRRDHMRTATETSDTYYLAEHSAPLHSSSPRSMPSTSEPPSRSGRYDPVRATFVPFSTPTVSPTTPPLCSGGGEVEKRADMNTSPVRENH